MSVKTRRSEMTKVQQISSAALSIYIFFQFIMKRIARCSVVLRIANDDRVRLIRQQFPAEAVSEKGVNVGDWQNDLIEINK